MKSQVSIIKCSFQKTFDISIIITFHQEKFIAKKMLDGFMLARDDAKENDIRVQLVCILDNPDKDTFNIVNSHPILKKDDWVLQVSTGDPGANRNIGVSFSNGEYIGVIDGDDFFSRNWIINGYQLASFYGASVVVHPEYVLSFGTKHSLNRLVDQREGNYPLSACVNVHPWVCPTIAHSIIFKTTPYLPTNVKSTGFGLEDWHWSLEIVAKGIFHIVASETGLFYRRKDDSIFKSERINQAIIRPSNFFDHIELWNHGFPLSNEYIKYCKNNPREFKSIQKPKLNKFLRFDSKQIRLRKLILKSFSKLPLYFRARLLTFFYESYKCFKKNSNESYDIEKYINNYKIFNKNWFINNSSEFIFFKFIKFFKKYRNGFISHEILRLLGQNSNNLLQKIKISNKSFPDWMKKDLAYLAKIEPTLFPSDHFFEKFHLFSASSDSFLGEQFASMLKSLKNRRYEIILLVPTFLNNPMEQDIIQYYNFYNSKFSSVILFTTENSFIYKNKKLEKIMIKDLWIFLRFFPMENQVFILTRLLLQLRPKIIHNFYSNLGIKCFEVHGKALISNGSNILDSSKPNDYPPELWPVRDSCNLIE